MRPHGEDITVNDQTAKSAQKKKTKPKKRLKGTENWNHNIDV